MAFFSQEKKQQKLILILILVVIAIFVTVYFGFLRPKTSAPTTAPIAGEGMTPAGGAVPGGGEIEDIDFLFLQDPRFLDLKKYGEWPIKPRETGRENPFEPFEGYSKDEPEEILEEIMEDIEEQLEEETLEEVIIEELEIEEPEESIEKATIEELLRLLNGGGEEEL